jgi:cytoskeletal protein CcmA (bactofilin family)
VPEGTTIGGSIRAANVETEIAGRVEGDVTVEGRLFLGPTAVVTGNIRATSCRIEGLVEGKMECAQEIELARTGRLNSDVVAGKVVTVAGQITGTVQTPVLRMVATGRVEGDVMTRQLHIEEGAVFNGRCAMKAPAAQRNQG